MPKTEPKREAVLAKCEAFMDFQLWPTREALDTEGWLSNFSPEEMPYALVLLNSFVYYPRKYVENLVCQSIHDLSCEVVTRSATYSTAKHAWNQFRASLIVTRVTGETPNDTDSSFHIVRMARQHAAVSEEKILSPHNLAAALPGQRNETIIFMDDFVGSGNQMCDTWKREYQSPAGPTSFEEIDSMGLGHRFFYLPIVATSYGVQKIHRIANNLNVRPSYLLGPEYNCLSPECKIWPDHMKPNVYSVIENASGRAGIPQDSWRGFHELGLAFAFEGSTPDATLPLFHWNENGWKRLVSRT